jgi:NADH:ubiquinone oxidoreductase subunit F (NADH-binding)/NADH:ubiquinone oxidoreductase subunit E
MIDRQTREKIESLASRYPSRESALMPAIHLLQKGSSRQIKSDDLWDLAELIGISRSRMYGVLSFYTMYYKEPIGKYHLQVDTNIPAMLMGSQEILEYLKKILGINAGETTRDGLFTLSEVEDLGSCGTLPAIQVNDRYYENLTIEKVDALIFHLREGRMPEWGSKTNYSSTCKILLKHRGLKNATSIDVYKAHDGYKSLAKALDMEPSDILTEITDSELRGLGGAGFPTGVKPGFLPKERVKPVYLLCNGDEGEPGTFKDRQIMEYDPHLLIEGMVILGYATGAQLGFIYIRGEFTWIAGILESAINEARDRGMLGKDILGKGVEFDIIVHLGAGSYIAGEETAMMNSLEGRRGNPRVKPPYPAVEGLYGCPSIINNVETISCIPCIIENGPDAFKKFGKPNNRGPKIFSVSGHVNKPGAYEFPLGTPVEIILDAAGGVKGNLKGIIVGGLSTPILTPEEAKGLEMDFDSCMERGTMLGTGGIIVINHTASIPEIAMRASRFYEHESCGQCVPCREGLRVIRALLEKILKGQGSVKDINQIVQLCNTIPGTTLCAMGDAFAIPIGAMVNKFRTEFEALVI